MIRLLSLFCAVAVLAGCASTMSEEQCAAADWYAYGYEDGARGATPGMANRRGEACYKHGFGMDHARYAEGRAQGLRVWCTALRGYELGRSGAAYNGVCVDHDEAEFVAAWERGRELHGYVSAVGEAEQSLSRASAEFSQLTNELLRYAGGERDENLSTAEHNSQMLELWSKRNWLQQEAMPYWEAELRFARRELESYEARIAAGEPSPGPRRTRFTGPEPYRGPDESQLLAMLAEVLSGQWNGR